MRYLTGLGLLFVANVALAGIETPSIPKYYEEGPGDAGNRFAPQNVHEGASNAPWSGFTGSLGGCEKDPESEGSDCLPGTTDSADAFRFYFAGGSFKMAFVLEDPLDDTNVTMKLYRDNLSPVDLIGTNDWGEPGTGTYIFEFETTVALDPQYFGSLFDIGQDRTTFPQLISPPLLPEPGALALLLTGLAGLGFSRRRARAA